MKFESEFSFSGGRSNFDLTPYWAYIDEMCQEILISTKGTKNSFILSSPMFSKVSQLVKVVNSDMATEQGEVLLLHKSISCISTINGCAVFCSWAFGWNTHYDRGQIEFWSDPSLSLSWIKILDEDTCATCATHILSLPCYSWITYPACCSCKTLCEGQIGGRSIFDLTPHWAYCYEIE